MSAAKPLSVEVDLAPVRVLAEIEAAIARVQGEPDRT
jgi:hypothetical protein